MFMPLATALQAVDERNLRDYYVNDERSLARLNSASGKICGKWLDAFPQSWWPQFHDTSFIMALRFRCGMKVSTSGQKCMHTKIKDRSVVCEKCLDCWGDHAISCGFGGHLFTRHGGLNHILCEAGRVAGYVAHCEQVVPELAQVTTSSEGVAKISEARIDVELFGHPYAPDHLLDGTIKHPGGASHVHNASREIGYTAEEGVKAKAKRYCARHGKVVLACSMETWGRTTGGFDALLQDLAMLAFRRQREHKT